MDDLLDGDLDDAGRRSLEEHVAECENCARRHEGMRALEQWARTLRPRSPSARFADCVMARLEPERPVRKTSATGIEMLIAAIIAAALVPVYLGVSETVYDWFVAVAGWTSDLFGSIAAEIGDAGRQALAGAMEFWTSFDQSQGPLSPLAMALIAVAAFLAMVVFNVFQARGLGHRI
jgi:anti-sigma factor RsiW